VSAAEAERSAHRSQVRISAIGVALLVALAALIWSEARWNARLQSAWFDTYQIVKPREVLSTPVTVVEIDEASLQRIGQWPWPRSVLAELVRDIEREQPLAIGLDILMPEPDRLSPERLLPRTGLRDPVLASRLDALPSNDSELAHAIAEGPVVLGIGGTPNYTNREPLAPPFVVVDRSAAGHPPTTIAADLPRYSGALTNLDELDRVAAGHGLISAGPSDDVIRRVPLAARIDERPVPSLPLELLRVALRARDIRLYVDGPSVERIAVGDFVAPTEPDGELRVYYSQRDPRRFVSAIDVLDGKVDPRRLQQKLVLIGTTGLAVVDYQNTPLGVRMPGSEVIAQVLENLYDQTWLMRPPWARELETLLFVLLGASLIWATPRWRPQNAALLALGCIVLPIAAAFAAFAWKRWVFDAAASSLGVLILFSVLLVLTLAETARQRRRLEHVVQEQRERAAYVAGELEAAKRIQTGFLPRTDQLASERRIELAASMTPAREVGGDLYDFFLLDRDRLFFLIGDVAGKGLSASMFMAVSKALYKSATLRRPDAPVSEMMRAANEEVSRDNGEMFFVTAFAGVLDLESGDLSYCNAGHENPYLLRPRARDLVRLADGAGPPLCTVERFAYDNGERRLQPGELLCLVTDGVADAQDAQGERYGSRRLEIVLSRVQGAACTARALVDALYAELKAFEAGAEQADDVTVLALRWLGPRGA
jgi:adenylate cyclase